MKKSTASKIFLLAVTLGLLILTFFLIRPFFHVLFFAIIMAFFLQPLYKSIKKKSKRPRLATFLTFLIFAITAILIMFIATNILYSQLNVFLRDLKALSDSTDLQEVFSGINFDRVIDQIQSIASSMPLVDIKVNEANIIDQIESVLSSIVSFFLGLLPNIGAFSTSVVVNLIVFIVALYSLIPNFDKIVQYIKKVSPLDDDLDEKLINRFLLMSKAMFKGTFLIAFLVGLVGTIVLALLGVKYSVFWGFLVMLFTIVPMGGGLVTVPIAVIFLLGESYFKGIFLILYQLLIAGNIDNVLRPKLVPKEVQKSEAILLVSFLGGIALFGFMGVFYGPIIVALLLTVLDYWKEL